MLCVLFGLQCKKECASPKAGDICSGPHDGHGLKAIRQNDVGVPGAGISPMAHCSLPTSRENWGLKKSSRVTPHFQSDSDLSFSPNKTEDLNWEFSRAFEILLGIGGGTYLQSHRTLDVHLKSLRTDVVVEMAAGDGCSASDDIGSQKWSWWPHLLKNGGCPYMDNVW